MRVEKWVFSGLALVCGLGLILSAALVMRLLNTAGAILLEDVALLLAFMALALFVMLAMLVYLVWRSK